MTIKVISILLPDLRGGGAERVNLDLGREFVREGYEVEFVVRRAQGEFLEEARQFFSVVDLKAARVRNLPRALFRYLQQRQPDVLLSAMWPLTFIGPFAARWASPRSRALVSEHGILSLQYRDWGLLHRFALRATTGLGYRLAHHLIGVSSGVAKDMAELSFMPAHRFETIYNPVSQRPVPSDLEFIAADSLWGVPRSKRILAVGRMKTVKNYPLLLRSFALLDDPEARLMFVGEGEGRAALASLAKELGVMDRVIFAGFRPDPTPFYRTADLFVLSSNSEGFGNVIVEALACGTYVVSTDCPSGPAEILDNGRYGSLVPVGDSAAMARAMRKALETQVEPERLRLRASEFTPQIAARKYIELIES